MEIVYLINPTAIKDITNLSDNLSDKYVRSALREAQDIGLNQVLGTRLLERLYTLVSTGDIKNTENAKYKKLLDSHISYYLAYETITNVVVIASVKIDNAGAVTSDAEKTNGLELKDIFKIESYYRQKADFYKSRLQAYLRMEHDNFPELEYEDAYNTLAEIETAYTSTIFLGGKRGKKPYHPCYCKPAAPAPEPVKYTVNYFVDNVLFHTAKYRQGQIIEWVEAPAKEGQRFNCWIYGSSDNWVNLPGNMPAYDIDCYAHYIPVEGEQQYYTLRYRVADWREDGDITFDNMAYIPEPFEWLQCVEREYNPDTREGWAKLTHPNLRADSEIKFQKFTGYDCLFMLDLSDFNNVYMTDRMFADSTTLREFYPPKGLVGMEGYDFYNCQYLSTINFATADGYKEYQPYSYPATGAFCHCVSLEAILADNQPHMHSQDGNLYNNSDELMAARYGEVTIKDGCTAILSESLKARGLTTLTIPASVRKIEAYAISENMELTDVYFGGTMQQWADIEKDDVNTIFEQTSVTVIHCSDGDCSIDYTGGGGEEPEEPAEHKIDIFLEWDYLETRWFKTGQLIELPEPPVREGYTFQSWNAIVPGGDWFDMPEYMPDYDFEVHASYTEAKPDYYNMNYYVDGELVHSESYKEGETIEAPTAEKEGHTFLGWEGLPSVMPAHDVEVNASFQVNTYKLVYKVDGEIVSETDVEYGTGIIAMEEPVKEGYTFSGWSEIPETMPAHDVEVTGSFTEVKQAYTLTYWNGNEGFKGDEVLKQISVIEGEAIDYFQPPVKEGFTHKHWTYHKDEGVIGNAQTEMPNMPGHDLDVWTYYTFNSYNVYYTLYDENGDVYLENYITYRYTDTINPFHPDIPEGYTFSWDNEPATMPAHDVHVTGSITKVEPSEPEDTTDYSTMYMTLEAIEDSEFTFSGTSYSTSVNYSIDDGVTWNKTKGKDAKTSLIPSGGKVLIKATKDEAASRVYVLSSGKFKTYGNILSTQHGDDFIGKEAIGSFKVSFYNSTNLVDASNLIFPSTDLTTLSTSNIYSSYFGGCTSLVTAPKILPSTSISSFSYSNMFKGCTSLTTPPVITATSMGNSSLYSMFEGCTSLTTAPVINVEHIANYGCYCMFKGCSNLTNVTMLFTSYDTGSTSNALYELLDGVASTGTFYKSPNMPLETIQQHVPSGWTILDYAG